jgi:hypothetical protein
MDSGLSTYSIIEVLEGPPVSIVRVGLGETKNFAEGYEAIFGKKKEDPKKSEADKAAEQAKKDEKKEEKK